MTPSAERSGPGAGPVSPLVAQQVRAHLAAPAEPARPRRAATVALVRDGADGVETLLLERAGTMAFAAGHLAFPGGAVEPEDGGARRADDGAARRVSLVFGCSEEDAAALLGAAVREVFEETGVLLAIDASTGSPVRPGPALVRGRGRLLAGQCALDEVLADCGAVLDGRLLTPWNRWITPVWSKRRYDTYFFLAEVPDGQEASGGSGEEASLRWRTAAAALADVRGGTALALTPTLEAFGELADAARCADVPVPASVRASTFSLDVRDGVADVLVDRPTGRTRLTTVALA